MKNSYPNHFKVEVLQYLEKVGSVAKASRKFRVHPSTVYGWKYIGIQEFLKSGPAVSSFPESGSDRKLKERLHLLERENAVLREAARLYFNC